MTWRATNIHKYLRAGRDAPLSRHTLFLAPLYAFIVFTLPIFFPLQAQSPARIETEEALLVALLDSAKEGYNSNKLLDEHLALVTPLLWDKLCKRALSAYYLNGPDQTLSLYKIALSIAKRLKDHKLVATTHYNIGRTFSSLSKVDAAIQSYLASKKAFESAGVRRDLIYIFSDLAALYLYATDYKQARFYAEQCIELAERLKGSDDPPGAWPDEFGVAGALSVLGALSRQDGIYTQAIEQIQKSLSLYQKLDRGTLRFGFYLADNITEMGRVYAAMGDHIQALSYLNQALNIVRKLPHPKLAANVLNSIGVLYLEQEDYEKADEYLHQSLHIYQALKNQAEQARIHLNIGVTEQRRGNFDQALNSLRKSLDQATAVSEKDVMIAAAEGLGVVYREKKDYRAALQILDRSLELAKEVDDQTRIAEVLWRKAEVHQEMGNFAEAAELSEDAHQIARQLQLPKLSYLTAASLGKAYLSQKKTDLAFHTLSRAIEQVEEMRGRVVGREQERQLFFENKVSAFHSMIELLVSQSRTFEALVYAEKAKSRVLLDVVSQGRARLRKAMTPKENEEDERLNQRIVKLNREIRDEQIKQSLDEKEIDRLRTELDTARVQYSSFQNSLYVSHPELKIRQGHTLSLSQENLSRLIDDETAFLEYVLMDERIYLFVITKASSRNRPNIELFSIDAAKKELSRRIDGFNRILEDREPGYIEQSQSLYGLLVKPAESALRRKRTLCIIPDGPLWDVSFQALQSQNGRFLIESHAIYYAPSLSVLSEMRKRGGTSNKNVSPSLLALANPFTGKEVIAQLRDAQRGESFDPLPESETEVRALAQIFGAGESKTLIGAQADEKTFKSLAPKYQTIHFATHGVLDNRHPLYSYLLLAKSDSSGDEDGLLEAREIMNLDLNIDLVVLSACDTARGRIGAGEGVIGMTWAFFIAGCRTMIVTQWKVGSANAADLMIGFFQSLKDGSPRDKMAKAEALRAAALKLIKNPQKRHPNFWAGFVMVGSN
jgi:CHAT domain-containing protein/Tfp pilus assembly protein PilF